MSELIDKLANNKYNCLEWYKHIMQMQTLVLVFMTAELLLYYFLPVNIPQRFKKSEECSERVNLNYILFCSVR